MGGGCRWHFSGGKEGQPGARGYAPSVPTKPKVFLGCVVGEFVGFFEGFKVIVANG